MEIIMTLRREWPSLKQKFWWMAFSQIVPPLLYFVIFGMRPGGMMNVDGQSYLHYLIPRFLTMTTMRNSYASVSTHISIMRFHEKSLGCHFYSPMQVYLPAIGHVLAGALRGVYSGVLILLFDLISGAGLIYNGWFLAAVALNTWIFSASGFLAAAMIRNHYDMNNFTNVVTTPMSLLCGIFFSLEGTPQAPKRPVDVISLTHTTRPIRRLSFEDNVNWTSMAVFALFVVVFAGRCI